MNPSPTRGYNVCLKIYTDAGLVPPLGTDAVRLLDWENVPVTYTHYNPSGSGCWGFGASGGKYKMRVTCPKIGPLTNFVLLLNPYTGVQMHDPKWDGEYIDQGSHVFEFHYPRDFLCTCYIGLGDPLNAAGQTVDAQLWLGDTQLVVGQAPNVPAGYENYYRATVPAGTYSLRLEHPAYVLPPHQPPLTLNASYLVTRIALRVAFPTMTTWRSAVPHFISTSANRSNSTPTCRPTWMRMASFGQAPTRVYWCEMAHRTVFAASHLAMSN